MPRAGPKKVHRYSLEFKLKAVKLSQLKDVEVQAVADALDIHPFILSRWRKEARDGVLRGRVSVPPVLKTPPVRDMKKFQALRDFPPVRSWYQKGAGVVVKCSHARHTDRDRRRAHRRDT